MKRGRSQARLAVGSSAKPLIGIAVWRHPHPAAAVPCADPAVLPGKSPRELIRLQKREKTPALASRVFLVVADQFPCRADVAQHAEGIAPRGAEAVGRESPTLLVLPNL